MDHAATREQLELAAIEPDGLERLMAGDTGTAQMVAAHLAGCPSCTEELSRLHRAAILIHRSVRDVPPADLRERTLARIRSEGVPRPLKAATVEVGAASGPSPVEEGAEAPAMPGTRMAPPVAITAPRFARNARLVGGLATIAAAVVLSIAATSVLVGGQLDQRLADQAGTIAALERVAAASLALSADPDARHIELTSVADPSLDGYLSFSPTTTELVVVASGLTPPAQGLEYRCWVELGGVRQRVGRMFFSQEQSYWVGPTPAIGGVSGRGRFGISLVDAAGSTVDGDPVLVGAF